ncbi:hypothetical protein N7510_007530 [Penicillium lagena]|uniref:uncharacterized protein n=1 Tax=Penicillium lagena TaxID=94218 RepID=UPI00253FABBB|nr:uncharacterized protein N7510_007530 [Penicillium lagena]KAJ5610811.1 hypothetical protein N7510_007530 [Penicillium lagena]
MRYTTAISVIIAASASLALADSDSKCAAQKVVDQCITDMKFQLENCDTGDWECMCTHSTNVVDCYNNCPEDSERLGAQQIRQQNCANARAYSGKAVDVATSTGVSSTAAVSMTRMATSSAAHSTSTGLVSSSDESTTHTEQSDSSSDEKPSKSLTGLSATSSPSQGAAVSNRVAETGMWLAFLGMGLGVAL